MNYRQKDGTAVSWRRAHHVSITNPLNGQAHFLFQEEDVVELDGKTMSLPGALSSVGGPFDPEGLIPLVNPQTGEPLGQSMSQVQLYVALHSLYMKLVAERDAAVPVTLTPSDPPPEESEVVALN